MGTGTDKNWEKGEVGVIKKREFWEGCWEEEEKEGRWQQDREEGRILFVESDQF